MKKYLLSLAIIAVSFSSFAQTPIRKGAVLLGGNIGGGIKTTKSADTATNKEKGLNVSLVYGKAIRENLILGFGISTWQQKYDNPISASEQRSSSYGANVFLRKYKQLGNSGFSLFAQATFNAMYDKSNIYTENGPVRERGKGWSVNVTGYPGISYSVSKKLQLESGFVNFLSLGYARNTTTIEAPQTTQKFKTNGFSFSSSLNNISALYVGYRILLM
ncbi:MAG: hypothetical protein EOO01_19060 [Chitinophagaceae bacterium]|nr:MAG: hypothetical protein EOO01_19060 [Chitinophagaceae bacterium]